MLNYAQLGRVAGSNPDQKKIKHANFLNILANLKPMLLRDKAPTTTWDKTKGSLYLRLYYKIKGEEGTRVFTVSTSKAVALQLVGKDYGSGMDALAHIAATYPINIIEEDAAGKPYDVPLFKFSRNGGNTEEISLAALSKIFMSQPEVEYADA